jgi:hypothetical protein
MEWKNGNSRFFIDSTVLVALLNLIGVLLTVYN